MNIDVKRPSILASMQATEIGQNEKGFFCFVLQICKKKHVLTVSFFPRSPYSHLLTSPTPVGLSFVLLLVQLFVQDLGRNGAIELVPLGPYRLLPRTYGRLSTRTELSTDLGDRFVLVNKATLAVDLGGTSEYRRVQIPILTSAGRSRQGAGHSTELDSGSAASKFIFCCLLLA